MSGETHQCAGLGSTGENDSLVLRLLAILGSQRKAQLAESVRTATKPNSGPLAIRLTATLAIEETLWLWHSFPTALG